MAYGYMRPDPVKAFRDCAGFYQQMIAAAESQGFTRQEAIELLKIQALRSIDDDLGSMG